MDFKEDFGSRIGPPGIDVSLEDICEPGKIVEYKPRYSERIKDLYEGRSTMIIYLELKKKEQDWHAVADAAMDLRELDAKIKILEEVERKT